MIEVSPNKVHLEYNKFMHGSRAGFLKKLKGDFAKVEYAAKNGFTMLEFHDDDIANLSLKYVQDKFGCDL